MEPSLSPPPEAPPRRPRGWPRNWRRPLAAGAAAGLLLAGLYGLYWAYVAASLEDGMVVWAEARRAEGMEVAHGPVIVTGFPFRVETTITAPRMARREGARPWAWSGPTLTFTARPWSITRFRIEAPGRHRVTATLGGGETAITLDTAQFTAKVRTGRGRTGRVKFMLADAVATADTVDGSGRVLARAKRAHVIVSRPAAITDSAGKKRPGALGLVVDADGLTSAREPVPGLGTETETLRARAVLTGVLPDGHGPDAMAGWRDAGGTVEIVAVDVRHGALSVAGDGTLALDDAMQPIGAFTLRVQGFEAAIDGAARAGAIKPHPAALAKVLLAARAKTPAGGGAPEITVPLSLQERRVYLGPVPLARMPRVRWD